MPTSSVSLLIVEDDASLRDALLDYLGSQAYRVRGAADGREMDKLLAAERPDLIILDLMLPGEDGLAICRRLPADAPPVLILSAMGSTTDRIVGLELGAADYLSKPFEPRELLARIRAVLRRPATAASSAASGSSATAATPATRGFAFGGWRLDPDERQVSSSTGAALALTPSEFDLLQVFVERPARLLSRDSLMSLLRGEQADASFDRAIDLLVSRLRRKLMQAGIGLVDGSAAIATVRTGGYRFELPVERVGR
jgi:two-component system OmpR family response regulator